MSLSEASVPSQTHLPSGPSPKLKPPIPHKPLYRPRTETGSPIEGQEGYVKRIVQHFNQQFSSTTEPQFAEKEQGCRKHKWGLSVVTAPLHNPQDGVACIPTLPLENGHPKTMEQELNKEMDGESQKMATPTTLIALSLHKQPRCPNKVPPPIPPRIPACWDRSRNTWLNSELQGTEVHAGKEQKKVGRKEEGHLRSVAVGPRSVHIDLDSRLHQEPLYQTYRAMAITKEIRRQTANCKGSLKEQRTGAGENRMGGCLWQDLPSVRDSGLLERLSSAECKHQESMFEVLTSETSYLRSLYVLTDHFLDSRDLQDTLIIRDKKTLFSNILRVREVSERFLEDLRKRVDQSPLIADICDIIYRHAQDNFSAYIVYVRNQTYQEKICSYLMEKNEQFARVIARLQESPQCQRLPFISFLLLPFQRITRIKMLIENILKRTKEGTTQERTASEALASVSKIIKECNTQVGKMKQMEELINVAKVLKFDKLKAVPIISQTRYLEKQGELQEMIKGTSLFSLRSKYTLIYLFLFNDLLIIAKSAGSSERYSVVDHAHRSLVQVCSINTERSGMELCFSLTLLENHQGHAVERLVKAPTQSDMHRWMAAFPNTNENMKEVVYEDWDCPQVQCIEQYVTKQTDELSLDPADIVNVVRKTKEGWYEGIRLSDGETGWFPAANVQEITNEHVRRRNLREQYRFAQAHAACLPVD